MPLKTMEGRYESGAIELLERPEGIERARVLVTFLPTTQGKESPVDLRARGITEAEAAEMRARMAGFAEDWERPEMEIYDRAPVPKR